MDGPRATPQAGLFGSADEPPRDRAGPGPASVQVPVQVPLAERLRPQTLAEVVGQPHLLGEGRPLARAFASGRMPSMILWGPPGVGKTTLARLVAEAVDARFVVLSAVNAGVKEIREAVAAADAERRRGRATVVFVDEVHRFNKAQQDAFLPHVESGLVTFVGATTENPSFEVNSALLSRAAVHVLRPLDEAALAQLVDRARTALDLPAFEAPALARLLGFADGDARRLLNAVEAVAEAAAARAEPRAPIGDTDLEAALGELLRRYDKGGDAFFDTISALHKSVRGSSPDAALYWLARLLDGGTDPRYVARRVVRMASEDIGLADPRALGVALDAAAAYERLGSPEGELMLAQAVVYLAVAPKSNALYTAFGAVRTLVRADGSRPVPMHLRNAPTSLMKGLGMGGGYRDAHDEPGAYAAGERYLPEGLARTRFYEPSGQGAEARIAERLAAWRLLDEPVEGIAPPPSQGG